MNRRSRLRTGVALTKSALGLLAGVARRTTRRSVAYGKAAGAYYYTAPGCQQVVNSYGQIVYPARRQP
jgi:hypothetical protein